MKIVVPALLILVMFSSCRDTQRPTYEGIENVKLGKAGVSRTGLAAHIRFHNPNKFGARLKRMDCDVYIDSTYFGHFTCDEAVRIKPGQPFIIPISGEAETLMMFAYSGKIMSGQKSWIRVQGKARVGRTGIFKTIPFDYADSLLLKF